MFDAFTKLAYRVGTQHRDPLADAFTSLPRGTLKKLAFGQIDCGGDGYKSWLERFEGTPMYEQALELLNEELQQEASELEQRQQSQQLYSASDQIRLRKKLLELELARHSMGTPDQAQVAAPSGADTGAPGAESQPTIQPPAGAPPKTASAPIELLRQMSKQADMAGLGNAALKFITKNPGLAAGTVAGTGYGALEGYKQKIDPATGQPTGGGITGALKGAIGTGALGGAAGWLGQGAIRSGITTSKLMSRAKRLNKEIPGGALGEFTRQAGHRVGNAIGDVQALGSHINSGLNEARSAVSPAAVKGPADWFAR